MESGDRNGDGSGGRRRMTLAFVALVLAVGAATAAAVVVADLGPGAPSTAGPSLDPGPGDPAPFAPVAADVGLEYTAVDRGTGMVNGGVYVTDYDGDGWQDVLAIGGPEPVLFENTGGRFAPSGALPAVEGTVSGAAVLDHDGDGDDDLLLLVLDAPPVLLENTGGAYRRADAGFGASLTFPVGAVTADYDGDGCLDLFVVQYADWDDRVPTAARFGHVGDVNRTADNGNPNVLYEGTCSSFRRVTDAGIRGREWSLAASFVDLTGDGRPDIHVANDFNEDVVYVNRGNGSFRETVLGGATDRNAMASEVGDVNGDGRPDVFVTNIDFPTDFDGSRIHYAGRARGNNLLINRGNGSFVDRAREYGVRAGGWGWAAVLADFDSDGDRDLFQATKVVPLPRSLQRRLVKEGRLESYKRAHPHLALPVVWERTDGGFAERNASRLGFGITTGTGVARADYDRDGDQDLLLAQRVGAFELYENRLGATANRALQVTVARAGAAPAPGPNGSSPSPSPALGGRLHVTVDGETRTYVLGGGTDFLSQDARTVHVGLGAHGSVDRLRVVWPDGTERVVEDLAGNRRVVIWPDGTVSTTARFGDGE